MNRINPIPTPKRINYTEEFIPCRLSGVKLYGEGGERLSHALSLLPFNTDFSESGDLIIYCGEDTLTEELKKTTSELFSLRFAKNQGYYLSSRGDKVTVCASGEMGCVYGLMTLLQLFD